MDSLDYIIDTIPVFYPLEPYLSLLKVDGKLIMAGVINQPMQFVTPMIMPGRKSSIGTFIGSMEEAQVMLKFCKEKGLTSMIEMVKMEYVNQAMERLERNDIGLLWMWLAANSVHNPQMMRAPIKGSRCVSTRFMVAGFIKLSLFFPCEWFMKWSIFE